VPICKRAIAPPYTPETSHHAADVTTRRLCTSFLSVGFECSSHYTRAGTRLDMIAASGHDRVVRSDYRQVRRHGFRTVREGIRWHLIEPRAGHYNFSSVLPMVRAARVAGIQVIWDLCHFGWPDHVDIFSPAFVDRFARMAKACVSLLAAEGDQAPAIVPINEISFFAWAGGEAAQFNPFARGRPDELKQQLVRTAITGVEAIWDAVPSARIVQIDPAIHVVADPERPAEAPHARAFREAQFQAWDMLIGRMKPELGGHPKYLDVVGINYYPHNQWVFNGPTLKRSHPQYLPLRCLLLENYRRYGRPILLAETGAEDTLRPSWLRYVGREVRAALRVGVPVDGICWYPILNHPGWEDGRHCCNGLWDYPTARGGRPLYAPLARELRRQQRAFDRFHAAVSARLSSTPPPETVT
jgi:hypothetical protein